MATTARNGLDAKFLRPTIRVGLGLAALLVVLRGLAIVRDFAEPTELMHTTSVPVYLAREVQHHRPIYRTFDHPPYVLSLYGPLLYALPGWIARARGLDLQGLFVLGRTISLAAFVSTVLVIAGLLRRWAKADGATVLLMAFALAVAPIAWPICMEMRSDAPELLATMGGLALLLRAERSNLRLASIPLFVVAFLYKQSAVAGPLSAALFLLVRKGRRAAAVYAAACGLAYAAALVVMNRTTSGAYALNCFAGLKANITPGNLLTVWTVASALSAAGPMALLAARVLRKGRRLELLSIYAIGSFLWACAGVLRDGSGANYFLGPLAASCIVGGRELAVWQRRRRRRPNRNTSAEVGPSRPSPSRFVRLPLALLGLSLLIPLAEQLPAAGVLVQQVRMRDAAHRQRLFLLESLGERLNALGDPVFCEDGTLNLYLRRPMMLDSLTFTGLADVGVFDDARLIDMIRTDRVAAFVLRFPLEQETPRYQSTPRVREEWIQAMRARGYVPMRSGWLYVYVRPDLAPGFEQPLPAQGPRS